jgi:hypothetical protein
MNEATALRIITNRAEAAADHSATARKRLDEAMKIPGAQLDGLMDAVLIADAEAKPWRELLIRIERHGVCKGLAAQREKVLEDLTGYSLSLSTSLVTNAWRLAEQNGLRHFLSATHGMEIGESEPLVPAEEPTLEPAPAPARAPKVTPAQRRTLEAIRDNGVKFREFTVKDGLKVGVERGEKPRKDMVEFVIDQGWAQRDATRPLFRGQPVVLTAVGEAILAR